MGKGSTSCNKPNRQPKKRKLSLSDNTDDDVQAEVAVRPHSASLHQLQSGNSNVAQLRVNLLEWFIKMRDVRGMPWRRVVTDTSPDEQAQRAYEVNDTVECCPLID